LKEKAFDKIQRPFMIKKNEETRRIIPQHNKGYTQQTYNQHYTEWAKTENISSKIRNEIRVSTLSILIQFSA
jgi:hypothetical protein